MGKKEKEPRKYDSSRRQERAASTQARVLEVATRLFAEKGYVETTMEAIASEAGVAVPTVYAAFGSKRGILSGLLDRLVTGESTPMPMLATARARAVFDESDPRRAVAMFASHMCEVQDRVTPIFEAMKHAARVEPDVAELYARVQNNRFMNLEAFARRLAERGALRDGLTVEDAGRIIWVLASPETRLSLHTHANWSADHYVAWLEQTLVAALLRPETA